MRAVLGFVLLFAAYGLLSGGVSTALFFFVLHPQWPGIEPTRAAGYITAALLAGATALWGGQRLWWRWRRTLGWIAIICGCGGIAEGVRMHAPISSSLIATHLLGILVGAGLLVAPKFSLQR